MRLWIRSRRVLPLAVALLILVIAGSMAGRRGAVVPVVFGAGGGSLGLASFVPLLWAAGVADAFAGRGQAAEVRPARRLLILDAVLLVGASALAAATFACFATVTGPALYGVGPVLIASAVACATTLRRGVGGGIFAVCVLLLSTSVYAIDAPASGFVRVFQPDGDVWWSFVCGVVGCAVAVWLLLSNRVRTQFRPTEQLE